MAHVISLRTEKAHRNREAYQRARDRCTQMCVELRGLVEERDRLERIVDGAGADDHAFRARQVERQALQLEEEAQRLRRRVARIKGQPQSNEPALL